MSFARSYSSKGGSLYDGYWSSFPTNHDQHYYYQHSSDEFGHYKLNHKDYSSNYNYNQYPDHILGGTRNYNNYQDALRIYREPNFDISYVNSHNSPCYKRRRISDSDWGDSRKYSYQPTIYASSSANYNSIPASIRPSASGRTNTTGKRDRSELEMDSDSVLMSKEEIERHSPSRKDGIDALNETRLRYSYCAFIQNLGMRLELPQTTIGTAMVLCHRFFVRRSHACHDRYLIATAALFLTAKSEETAQPLNNVLTTSCEIIHRQDMSVLTYMFPIGWFEQYRERVLEAEQLILTTLNFELEVQHPFDPLTSALDKLGLSQSMLVNLALSLVSEGVYTRLDARLFDILSCGYGVMKLYLTSEVELLMCCGFLNTEFTLSSWSLDIPNCLGLVPDDSICCLALMIKKRKKKKKRGSCGNVSRLLHLSECGVRQGGDWERENVITMSPWLLDKGGRLEEEKKECKHNIKNRGNEKNIVAEKVSKRSEAPKPFSLASLCNLMNTLSSI